jgi:dihydropteroate synthase
LNRSGFETWLNQPAPERRPLVMGVVNLTPDSFSDGGTLANLTDAIAYVRELIDAGADLLDIGGESTRPGSIPTPAATQLARVEPVLRGLDEAKLHESIVISIDTTHSVVARRAIELGTSIVNDISAGRDDP